MAAAGTLAACDQGKQADQRIGGPQISVVGVNVGLDRPMPADGVVQIAVDRYLLPSSVNRQSLTIVDANNQAVTADKAPIIVYDPVARTVTVGAPSVGPWLTPGQPYKLVVALGGLKAIDGAGLAPNQPLLKPLTKDIFAVEFVVAGTPSADAGPPGMPVTTEEGVTADLPKVDFCRDVFPIFFLKCGGPQCHGAGNTAAASLVLDSQIGIERTAINQVAQGSNVGPIAGTPPSEARRVFGADMPIISRHASLASGSPGNSWLMYKVEMAAQPVSQEPRPALECDGRVEPGAAPSYRPLAPQPRPYADDLERSILSDHVLGREMPFPVPQTGGDYTASPLTFDERELIRIWIATGSKTTDCGGCRIATPPSDAGTTTDAATPPADAGAD